jgi:hypothetical protein
VNILQELHAEENNLKRQLKAVQGAIAALNGNTKPAASTGHASSPNGAGRGRVLSAAGRAAISRAAKARWAKFKAAKTQKRK